MLRSGATPMLYIVPDSLNRHKSYAYACKRLFIVNPLHYFDLLSNTIYLA